MSTGIKELIHRLIASNIKVALEGDQLKIRADEGLLTPEIVSELRQKKPELIAYLRQVSGKKHDNTIQPIAKKEHYELSHAQKRLWILDQFEEARTAYNMGNVYYFEGRFQPDALEFIIRKWIERHEVFRTTFRKVDGEPRQFISKTMEGELPYQILDILPENAEDKIKVMVHEELQTRFNLSKGPLFKIRLYRISRERCVFLVLMHHIVSDGWSLEVLMREFVDLYNKFVSGEAYDIEPLAIQYKDYAHWHNRQLSESGIEVLKNFWKNMYRDGVPKIDLPRDFNRPSIKTYNGKHIVRSLDRETAKGLIKISEEHNTTLFMSLLSCAGVLLYRYTGQDDMVIGATIAGRPVYELDNQIGFFVNTLPLRIQYDGTRSYTEFSSMIRQLCLNAFEHQAYPFDMLVDELNIERDISRSPMFDVMVQLLNTNSIKKKTGGLEGMTVSQYPFDNLTSQFDLCFNFLEEQEGISLDLEFNTDLFNEDRMHRLIALFEAMVKTIVAAPHKSLDEFDYVLSPERTRIIDFNNTEQDFTGYKNIIELFREQRSMHPDTPAVWADGDTITYKQLDVESDRFSGFILNRHLDKSSPVGIMHDKSISAICAILGVMKAGYAYVPIDPSLPGERIKFILKDCGIKALISQKKYEDQNIKMQWECSHFYILINTDQENGEGEKYEKELEDQAEMWDYLGDNFNDEIELGGWISSYTGQPFSKHEMEEYSENALIKLKPYLTKENRVLEIGCSSGLTLFKIAPLVNYYHGTDLSERILLKTKEQANSKGLNNVFFTALGAHDIHTVKDTYDIVIINSVIQSFTGHKYLIDVIKKCLKLLNPGGLIFFGDIQDLDKKELLIKSLQQFNIENENDEYLVKSDWSNELFLSKAFFTDLTKVFPQITHVDFSDKIGELSNELRDYRFDCIATIGTTPEDSIRETPHGFRKMQFDPGDLEKTPAQYDAPQILAQQMAYIIYTSGTTGNPKGVMVSHDNLLNIALSWRKRYELETYPVKLAQIANMSFDVFFGDLCRALLNGGTLYLCDKELILDIPRFYDYLKKHQINILESTVGLILPLMKYIHQEKLEYSFLRLLILGSDVCLMKDFEWLRERFGDHIKIINSYGTTETSIDSSYYEVGDGSVNIEGYVPIGKPMDNIKYFILDKSKHIAPIGVRGTLHIAGRGVALGYINRPELTRERFFELSIEGQSHKAYNTGDMACWLPDGNVQFIGRDDHQVKIRGYRVEIEEIENVLIRYELIEQAVVLVKKDEDDHNYLVVYIVGKNKRLKAADVKEYAKQHLTDHLRPRHVRIIDELPYTSNGKIDRKALLNYKKYDESIDQVCEPTTPAEHQLVVIWKQLLGTDHMGIRDNFFEMGGHSLKAVQMVSRIHKEMEIRLDIKDVFICQTIEELATRVEAVKWIKTEAETDFTDNERIVL